MKRARGLDVFSLCVALASPALAYGAAGMEEGNWEVTMKMEMPGMPMAMPPVTHNQCVQKNDVVPDMSQRGQDCVLKDQKIAGNTVTWQMQCKGADGTMDGKGRITYNGKTYEGLMQATMTRGSDVMTINYQMQGRHTGPCRADSKKSAKRPGDY